jgi:hypothetical protein
MLTVLLAAYAISTAAPTVEVLTEANANAIGLIRSLDVTYSHELHTVQGASEQRTARERWLLRGEQEHFWSDAAYLPPTADGRPTNLREWVLVNNQYRMLLNWDPKNPQEIRPLLQGTVQAEIGPRLDRNPTGINPAFKLMLEIAQYPRRSLSDFVHSSTATRVVGQRELNGHDCWVLNIETAAEPRIKSVEIWIDPSCNFMIAQRIERDPEFVHANGDKGLTSMFTVQEFRDCGDGAFFPTRIEIRGCGGKGCDPAAAPLNSTILVTSLEVNPKLADELFELEFPKYAVVKHMPPVNGRIQVDVWGDGKPLASANSVEELWAIDSALMDDTDTPMKNEHLANPTPRESVKSSILVYSLGAVLIVGVLLVIARRWHWQP